MQSPILFLRHLQYYLRMLVLRNQVVYAFRYYNLDFKLNFINFGMPHKKCHRPISSALRNRVVFYFLPMLAAIKYRQSWYSMNFLTLWFSFTFTFASHLLRLHPIDGVHLRRFKRIRLRFGSTPCQFLMQYPITPLYFGIAFLSQQKLLLQ